MTIDPAGANDDREAIRQPPRPPTSEEWEARWQGYWSRAGTLDYELGESEWDDSAELQERDFLAQARTPEASASGCDGSTRSSSGDFSSSTALDRLSPCSARLGSARGRHSTSWAAKSVVSWPVPVSLS